MSVPQTTIVPAHSAVNVNGDTLALAANAMRVYALFVNDSNSPIYLSLGAAAVTNQGIRLNANGGSYEISHAFGNWYQGEVRANHGGVGNMLLLVTEGVLWGH